MAELAGLSVAANVAQFVVLGLQSANYLYKAYNDASDFKDERQRIQVIAQDLDTTLKQLESDVKIAADDPELARVLKASLKVGAELKAKQKRLDEYAGKDAWISRVVFSVRSLLSKTEVERLLNQLVSLRDEVSHHLVVLSYRSMGLLIGRVDSMGTKIQENHERAQTQLAALHRDLEASQERMKTAGDQELFTTFKRMADEAKATAQNCLARHRSEGVLKSLLFDKIIERQSDIPIAHKNTFSWALKNKSTNLARWLREEDGIYWIRGKAGSGKSTLMKYLEHDTQAHEILRCWAGDRPLLVASHYFWAIGTDLQRNMMGLFQTLLFRIFILDPSLLIEVCPEKLEFQNHLVPWTFEDLKRCFQSLSAMDRLPSKICFFIDGLDEFQGDRQELLDTVKTAALSRDIKICVSSRPWERFQSAFGTSIWQLSVHDLTRDDIRVYARDNLRANKRFAALHDAGPEKAGLLTEELAEAADGVFLWVYLVTRQLLEGLEEYNEDITELRARVQAMPRDLAPYFARMLDAIDGQYRNETSVIFTMVASTQTPITTLHTWGLRQYDNFAKTTAGKETFNACFASGDIFQLKEEWETADEQSRQVVTSPYDAEKEKRRVASRCKDLVHVADVPDSSTPTSFKVGFLHRTVADFLRLDSTSRIIENRLDKNSGGSIQLHGLQGLAQASMGLLIESRYSSNPSWYRVVKETVVPLENDHFFHALHHAKNIRAICPETSRRSMFQLWSLMSPLDLPIRRARVSGETKPVEIGLVWKYQQQSFSRFGPTELLINAMPIESFREARHSEHDLLLANLRAMPIESFREARHSEHDLLLANLRAVRDSGFYRDSRDRSLGLRLAETQSIYWLMTCGKCLQSQWDTEVDHLPSSLGQFLLVHLQRLEASCGAPDANMNAASDPPERYFLSKADGLLSQQAENVELGTIKIFINSLESGDGYELRLCQFWKEILRTLSILHRAEVHEEGNSPMPRNLHEVCQLLIRKGAPRYICFMGANAKIDKSTILKEATEGMESFEMKFKMSEDFRFGVDAAKLLNAIPDIARYFPDGIENEFLVMGNGMEDHSQLSFTISSMRRFIVAWIAGKPTSESKTEEMERVLR